jgi:hypothetical protein
MNLKQVLMDLGNRLVIERSYCPGAYINFMSDSLEKSGLGTIASALRDTGGKDTTPIVLFTDWLNRNQDAREILEDMGIEWPVVKEKV